VEIYTVSKKDQEMLTFFDLKIREFHSNKEVIGNIYFHLGQYYLSIEDNPKAKENFILAKKNFEKVLEKDHYVFQILDEVISDI
jgi:hypothetical protein